MKRTALFLSVGAAVMLLASGAMAGNQVDVCHKGRAISVSESAVPAHEAHGDHVVLGQDLCGDYIDNDCDGVIDEGCTCQPCTDDADCVMADESCYSCACELSSPTASAFDCVGGCPADEPDRCANDGIFLNCTGFSH